MLRVLVLDAALSVCWNHKNIAKSQFAWSCYNQETEARHCHAAEFQPHTMTFLNAPPALDWPLQFCASTTAITYILSVVTSNVSQVDRVWTFLPSIYTAYFALLPWWPNEQPFFLFPYTPKSIGWAVATTYSPRALLMLSLVVIWMFRYAIQRSKRN